MKKLTRVLSVLLVLAMVFSMVACGKQGTETTAGPTTTVGSNTEKGTYIVTVKTEGGMPLANIDVYIYVGSDTGDLKKFASTNENGQAIFELPVADNYVAVLSGVTEGYSVQPYYAFNGNACTILLKSQLITGESVNNVVFELGDIMYDFTVTDPDGNLITLSQALAENKMVMLNFWFADCTYCVEEFPFVEEVYQEYGDLMEIIALNPYPTDSDADVVEMATQLGLSFPMAKCDMAFNAGNFGSGGYPTSVFVDRYGMVALIINGAFPNKYTLETLVKHFTAEDYDQKIVTSLDDVVSQMKPSDELEADAWLSSEDIGALLNQGELNIQYRHEDDPDDAEYAWPFIAGEKDGVSCMMTSNKEIDSSFAIIYADVELKAGQAIGFDYICSSEQAGDALYVIVNDEPIYTISGDSNEGQWQHCFPWVATEDGTYEVALCYIKDGSVNGGEDTVYIKNMRVVDASEIDTATYIPHYPAVEQADGSFLYADIFYNEADGYYHVGSENGPLLLANIMGYTQLVEDDYLYNLAIQGEFVIDGYDYREDLVEFANYASNAKLTGYCTVTKELAELLAILDDVIGFDGHEMEWLKLCKYYNAYGTDTELEDPIKGLAHFSALTAVEGEGWFNAETGEYSGYNCFYYNGTPIMPRGYLAKFVPEKSGVYHIQSLCGGEVLVDGWIFNADKQLLCENENEYRNFQDLYNTNMVMYMEAGKEYFIDIAFWNLYEVGYIPFSIEYLGSTYDLFRLASPPTFTYTLNDDGSLITDANGNVVSELIAGGIDVVLDENGYYRHDLGKDENGNQIYGSYIYAEFTGITAVISKPIATVPVVDASGNQTEILGLIDAGAFNFSLSEYDAEILNYIQMCDGDLEATDAKLREVWGEDYEAYTEIYMLQEIFDAYQGIGSYHGTGEDETEAIRAYLSKVSKSGNEKGCVKVDAELARLLQLLMDKYTFEGVENAWLKLCYYYDYLG